MAQHDVVVIGTAPPVIVGSGADGVRGRALSEISPVADGWKQLTAADDASTEVAVRLRPLHRSRDILFRARTFPARDGTTDRVVLLTVAGDSWTLAGAD